MPTPQQSDLPVVTAPAASLAMPAAADSANDTNDANVANDADHPDHPDHPDHAGAANNVDVLNFATIPNVPTAVAVSPASTGMSDVDPPTGAKSSGGGGSDNPLPHALATELSDDLWDDCPDNTHVDAVEDDPAGISNVGVFDELGNFSFDDAADEAQIEYDDDPNSIAKMEFILDGNNEFDDIPSNTGSWQFDALAEGYDSTGYTAMFLDESAPSALPSKPAPSSPPKRPRYPPLRSALNTEPNQKQSRQISLDHPDMLLPEPHEIPRVLSNPQSLSPAASALDEKCDATRPPGSDAASRKSASTVRDAIAIDTQSRTFLNPRIPGEQQNREREPPMPTRDADLSSLIRRLEQVVCSLDVSARACLRDALMSLSSKASTPHISPTPEQAAINRAAEYLVLRMLFLSGPQDSCAPQSDVLVGGASTPIAPNESPVAAPGYHPSRVLAGSVRPVTSPSHTAEQTREAANLKPRNWVGRGDDIAQSSSPPN